MKWAFGAFFAVIFVFLAVFGVNCCYGYVFPLKYREEVSVACKRFDVDEAVIFSVINIESHFNPKTISKKGAVGLMQVLPSTAGEIASEIGLVGFDLTNPQDNILVGVYYIRQLSNRFENLETALCAYNAGPANVNAWLKDSGKSDDGKTLKKIPFAETNGYIKKFRKNFKYYSAKLK